MTITPVTLPPPLPLVTLAPPGVAVVVGPPRPVFVTPPTPADAIRVIVGGPGAPPVEGGGNVFVQPTAPVTDLATYVWFDTSGGDLTIWVEDGT